MNPTKIRVIKTLLCSDGPHGGFPIGAVFDAPFPPGIARELKLDEKNIKNGIGAIEILGDEPVLIASRAADPGEDFIGMNEDESESVIGGENEGTMQGQGLTGNETAPVKKVKRGKGRPSRNS
ncbi:MAG: hypothetical protein RBQ87_01255 [Candidatus Cloacimonadaceae bacterium]|jgi:hypothetical protein|nr:hypothetical protein [Candidatus Cloacimonadaceae bacterium]